MEAIETKEWRDVVNKSGWQEGPWMSEPDRVQWTDPSTGYPCLILRHSTVGHLCGYVGVPVSNKCHHVEDDDIHPADGGYVDVHGGLTFSAFGKPRYVDFEGVNADAFASIWIVGFDCTHDGDHAPGRKTIASLGGVYRDVAYVKREVTKLAAQLGLLEK